MLHIPAFRDFLFSAYAEVFPCGTWMGRRAFPFLCLRRGVSPTRIQPPEWRALFSAYAEVFLPSRIHPISCWSFLCLRRGVSNPVWWSFFTFNFSLPTQRCFHLDYGDLILMQLFSAYAEVFLERISRPTAPVAFLCLRRGVSISTTSAQGWLSFSLPTQRCFLAAESGGRAARLFSAYAEVFLHSAVFVFPPRHFSLPTQRCFLDTKLSAKISQLFSAYAEVFP